MKTSAAFIGLVLVLALTSGMAVPADNVEPVAGPPNAPIRIEVFSDYQCPSCRSFYLETIRPIIDTYGKTNRVCVIYYDYPLVQHAHAREAARFAIAARRLGKWVQVSDGLYSEQAIWSADGKVEAAVARSLTPDELARTKKLINDPSVTQEIERDIMIANGRGVTSTPTLFVTANGREQKVVGGVSLPVLRNFIDQNSR